MSKTEAARLANERKADLLELELIEAFRFAPESAFYSHGEAARCLAGASGLAPPGSLRKYLAIYKARGDKGSRFHRLFAAREGQAKRRHETMWPDRPATWCNREGLPVEPAPVLPAPVRAEPAPWVLPAPVRAEPRPAPPPEPQAYDPMKWRYS